MRTAGSIFLTLLGLSLFYLFACGALQTAGGEWSFAEAMDRAARPFLSVDSYSLFALSIGVACFASGVVVSPRTTIWVKLPSAKKGSKLIQYREAFSTEKLLETGLVINVLVAAAIYALLSIAVLDDSHTPPRTLGSLLVIAVVQVILGLILSIILLFKKKHLHFRRWGRVFTFSAGLNLVEVILLCCVLLLAYV